MSLFIPNFLGFPQFFNALQNIGFLRLKDSITTVATVLQTGEVDILKLKFEVL
jgi:hypothetical protein